MIPSKEKEKSQIPDRDYAKNRIIKKDGRKGRKSTYDPKIHPTVIANLTLSGYTDSDVARLVGITRQTLMQWRKKDEYLKTYTEKEKEKADLPIIESLRKRCLGYEIDETMIESETNARGDRIGSKVRKVSRHVPADPTSMIFWLKNRDPNRWNDRRIIQISSDEIDQKKREMKEIFDRGVAAAVAAEDESEIKDDGTVKNGA